MSLEQLGKVEVKLPFTLINYLSFFPLRDQETTFQHSWVMDSSLSIHATYLNVRVMISAVQSRIMKLGSDFSCSYSSPSYSMHKEWLRYTKPFSLLYDGIFPPTEYFFTIVVLMRGKIGVGVGANYLAALVIGSIASKCIFLEILGCYSIRDLRGRGDDEGSLCSRRADLAQAQSPPAQPQLKGWASEGGGSAGKATEAEPGLPQALLVSRDYCLLTRLPSLLHRNFC